MTPRTLVQTSLAALALAACDGSGGPAGPNGDGDTYPGTWTARVTHVATGTTSSFTCAGSATIADNGSTIRGSFRLSDTGEGCDTVVGTLEGTMLPGGEIAFVLDPDPFDDFEIEGCTTVSQAAFFSGDLSGSSISFEGSITLDCEGDISGRYRFTVSFEGHR